MSANNLRAIEAWKVMRKNKNANATEPHGQADTKGTLRRTSETPQKRAMHVTRSICGEKALLRFFLGSIDSPREYNNADAA